MESIPPPLNGHAEVTPADDEPEDNTDALNRVSDGWQLSTVGGTDLTRLGAAVSAGGARQRAGAGRQVREDREGAQHGRGHCHPALKQ